MLKDMRTGMPITKEKYRNMSPSEQMFVYGRPLFDYMGVDDDSLCHKEEPATAKGDV